MCDNEAAHHIVVNLVYHKRTKHIEIECYFVREHVVSGEIKPCPVRSEFQTTAIFTKALGVDRFQFLCSKLGVRDLHSPT